MKINVNRINGKSYLYAYDTLFIAKGKTVRKTKFLGRADGMGDLSLKKQDAANYFMEQEAKLRTEHWEKNIHQPHFLRYVPISKLEELRGGLYRAKQEMGPAGTAAMEMAFSVDFIFNSNKLEGSRVPRESVEKQVTAGTLAKNNEVSNTLRAIHYVNAAFKFTPFHIKKLHSILLAHETGKLGFRKEPVVVGQSTVAEWEEIQKRIEELLDWYEKAGKTWYPPELAFTFYYRFERIHPFIDGNGRVGRLIMNRVLKDHRYHPIILWNKRRQAHLTAFEQCERGQDETFFKFMADQFIKTHEVYLEKIQNAFDLDKQLKFFLVPSKYNLD